jgi:hypothetical protein
LLSPAPLFLTERSVVIVLKLAEVTMLATTKATMFDIVLPKEPLMAPLVVSNIHDKYTLIPLPALKPVVDNIVSRLNNNMSGIVWSAPTNSHGIHESGNMIGEKDDLDMSKIKENIMMKVKLTGVGIRVSILRICKLYVVFICWPPNPSNSICSRPIWSMLLKVEMMSIKTYLKRIQMLCK